MMQLRKRPLPGAKARVHFRLSCAAGRGVSTQAQRACHARKRIRRMIENDLVTILPWGAGPGPEGQQAGS
jgi:hypothetical protein